MDKDEDGLKLKDLQSSNNIAELLDDQKLLEIGNSVYKGYEMDLASRHEWDSIVEQAMEIAKQVMQKKSFPWENASNIKFPLIAQAGIDYASRTMPEIIQNDQIVKGVVIGNDPDDKKYQRACRVSQYMSYQLVEQSMGWIEDTDMLLQVLPILGTVFRKTYYDELEKYNCSEMCVPSKIVINYDTQSLEKAQRITHVITLYDNDIVERQRSGLFCELDLELLQSIHSEDEDSGKELLEQHCFLDLDCDGYKEPYIVTIHKESKQVLRIVNRFKEVIKDGKGKVLRIVPDQYFTDFHFIRSPDGGFYSMGFGSLLLPINKAINTLINQLIDSGTLNNMQGGLIGRGLRIKNGSLRFKMGEWQVLDAASGEDIHKNIFPWPTKEPSKVLFELLGLLMKVGKDLSSTTDVMHGAQNAQNAASGAISQLIEQGTKVFVAINKRLYRSLKKEYRKLYDLNCKYLTQEEYSEVMDDKLARVKTDFTEKGIDVIPIADPTVSTESQRVVRAGLMQHLRTADPHEADLLLLQAMQVDPKVIKKLIPKPDPKAPPSPEQQKLIAEVALIKAQIADMQDKSQLQAQSNEIDKAKVQQELKESNSRINESVARSWKMQADNLTNIKKLAIVEAKMISEQQLKAEELIHSVDIDQAKTLIDAHNAVRGADNNQAKTLIEAHNAVQGADVSKAKTIVDAHKVKLDAEAPSGTNSKQS